MTTRKLSLWQAVLININVMLGTGIIINTVNLAKIAGALGFLSYAIVALLLAPLIVCIAEQLKRYPTGGFFDYGAYDITPFAGFLSSWAYFTGKLASATLLVHVFTSLLAAIAPYAAGVNQLILDACIIILFALLNLMNVKAGMRVIYVFVACKLTPIIFLTTSSLYLYQYWSIPPGTLLWTGIPATLPLVLYAFVGFEAACSISRSIENAQENGPKAIFYSYGLVIILNVLYQLLFFFVLNTQLMGLDNYLAAFPTLLQFLMPQNTALAMHILNILYIAACAAALGGSYGILFSNHWNLYTLAQHKLVPFSWLLVKHNKQGIPVGGVLVEMLICLMYLFSTQANQIILQQLSVLGCIIAYAISVWGLAKARWQGKTLALSSWIVWAGMGSCLIMIGTVIGSFMRYGITPLCAFGAILTLGSLMFVYSTRARTAS